MSAFIWWSIIIVTAEKPLPSSLGLSGSNFLTGIGGHIVICCRHLLGNCLILECCSHILFVGVHVGCVITPGKKEWPDVQRAVSGSMKSAWTFPKVCLLKNLRGHALTASNLQLHITPYTGIKDFYCVSYTGLCMSGIFVLCCTIICCLFHVCTKFALTIICTIYA